VVFGATQKLIDTILAWSWPGDVYPGEAVRPSKSSSMAPDTYVIGIDLGTANTCVGVYRDDHVEIIPDDGHHSIPSYVAFTETQRLIGAAAKNQAGINPENTIFDVMRLVGRKFVDVEVQADMKHYPFKVVDRKGKPHIRVEHKCCTKILTPEEVISMILSRAKESAEAYLGGTVSGAVITVPAHFNTPQRQSIRDAALISGLPLLVLINAPTAAAVDYTISRWQDGIRRSVLVFDLGAGTCDVMLATIENGTLKVRSIASDLHLGGEDFDNRIVNHLVNAFKLEQKKDLTSRSRSLRRLRTACESAKRELSSRKETQIEVDSIYEGLDLKSALTRERFEELCADLFRSILEPIERVLIDGKMNEFDIHEIVVVGGSSRIPKIQKLISDFFNGKDISRSLNPDEAAARGAAMYAALRSGSYTGSSKLWNFLLLDVLPISLGIEVAGGEMIPLIKRNTTIPTKQAEVFTTSEDNISLFQVSILEGECARAKDCTLLGRYSVPLTLAPRGVHRIGVTVECDGNCNAAVMVTEKYTGHASQLHLSCYDRLSKEGVERMRAEAEKYKADDKAEAERISARNALELCAYSLRSDSKFAREATLAETVISWLEENQSAATWEYRLRQTELEETLASLLHRPSESSNAGTTKADSPDNLRSPGQPSQMPDPPPQPSQSFSAEAPRDSEARTDISNPPSPDWSPSNDRGLGDFFSAPTSSEELQRVYTDAELNLISTHLRNSGRLSWSNVPRLYTVLRLIEQLPMLDSFVDQGITDIWFPFTSASLPDTLAPSSRASFLKSQSVVLSKSLRFEKSSERKHVHFTEGEPLPYEVVGRLGSGAHGFVDKVMSLISHREYARKSFRRIRGVGKDHIKSFLMELQVLKKISHIHCVELVSAFSLSSLWPHWLASSSWLTYCHRYKVTPIQNTLQS
jgi:L1 cell adhesion molecule like protein